MGRQWLHSGRLDAAAKRGLIVGKLAKEISVSARIGGADPDSNYRLRAAIEAARKASVTRDTIERAIKKGAGLLDGANQFDNVAYEGFAPHKVPVIVECITDNKNRTASEIRILFKKGQLGNSGAVAWMFDRVGIVEASKAEAGIDIEAVAIECGAQNVEPLEVDDHTEAQSTGARFFTETSDLDAVNKALSGMGWAISRTELGYVPKNYTELSADQRKEVEEFLGAIEEFDDVHRVYAALK